MRGNQLATIDEKGRLKVPSSFRSEIEDRLAKLPALNPTKKKFLDRTNYYGQLASIDKSGRILIPSLLRESADMNGEVVVLGQLNYLDVWNHKKFLSKLKEQEFTDEDNQTLAQLGI